MEAAETPEQQTEPRERVTVAGGLIQNIDKPDQDGDEYFEGIW
jgi:hypothetical protein